jgi:predicted nucleotidyltransferase
VGRRLGVDEEGLAKFLRRVDERFPLERAVLFGSRARGDELAESDYDLLLVSPGFAGLAFAERIAEVQGLWELPESVEPLCYTPEELERKRHEIGIVAEALREGRALALPSGRIAPALSRRP